MDAPASASPASARPPNLRRQITGVIFLVVSISSMVIGYLSYMATASVIERAMERELQTAATVLQNDLQEQTDKAMARATMVSRIPIVINSLKAQNRQPIIDALGPMFQILREKYGVREGHFHLPPATSFLRIYDPSAGHGEDLSTFRALVLQANQTKKPYAGIEIGRRGLSIRGIDVIADEGGHYGSVEVGMDFGTILFNIKKNLGFEAGVFVDDKKMSEIATLIPRPDPERIVAGYQNAESTDWATIRAVLSPDLLRSVTDVHTRQVTLEETDYGLVIVPLSDFQGIPIGSVLAVKNFSDYSNQLMSARIRSIGLAFIQGLLLSVLMQVLIHAFFVRLVPESTPHA